MAHSLNPPKWFLHHCYGHSEHLTLHYVTLVCVGLQKLVKHYVQYRFNI